MDDLAEQLQKRLEFERRVANEIAQHPYTGGRKLGHVEQFTAFAALQRGIRPEVIAKAYDLTSGTVSYLKHCLDKNSKRYRAVVREWERLGSVEFDRAYYHDDDHTKFMRILYDVAKPLDTRRSGPSMRADRYAFVNYGAFALVGPMDVREYWRIDWTNGDWYQGEVKNTLGPPGWRFHVCAPNGDLIKMDIFPYNGIECLVGGEPRPFRTSAAAYEGLEKMLGLRE